MYREVKSNGGIIGFNYSYGKGRSMRIRVLDDLSVKVTIPKNYSLKNMDEFVVEQSNFIEKAKRKLENKMRKLYCNYNNTDEGDEFFLLGNRITLKIIQADKNMVKADEKYLYVHTIRPNNKTLLKKLINHYFKEVAIEIYNDLFEKYYDAYSEIATVPKPFLELKKVKSYWGQCYSNGKIIMNQYLIHTPYRCVESVVCHEICHFLHAGHGKNFYKILVNVMPDYYDRQNELKNFISYEYRN